MNSPLRKNLQSDLSTADIARSNQTENLHRVTDAAEPETAEVRKQPAKVVAASRTPTAVATPAEATPLFPEQELPNLRNSWDDIQAGFVDEPRKSVEEADSLVASTMKRLAEVFAQERSKLEGQWDRGDNVSTEDLRVALQRYRSFFHRLLSI